MADPTTTGAWIGLGAGALALVSGALKLVTDVLQARRKPQPPMLPPPTAWLALAASEMSAASKQRVLLPGRSLFINREHELQELVSRVREGHDNVLTIEGDRWVGKSATATELAHCLLSEPAQGAFDPREHNFLWIDARDGCPSLGDICGQLSLLTDDQSLSATADEHKPDRLRLHLADSKTVLLLDNLSLSDDPDSVALIDFLRDFPNGSLVIASVNRPGDLVAPRVPLVDLDEVNVRKLIEDRVERLKLDGADQFDEQFAARLHALIGGNPGVIEWFLRGYRHSSESIEERMATIEKGSGLSELFEPTWVMLDDASRSALAACAHLSGEATTQQLATACARSEDELRPVIEELRREGLLNPVRATDRATVYSCARAFQLFVASKTPVDVQTRFTERLADRYLAYFTANPEDARFAAGEIGALRVVREELFDAGDDARIQALFWVTLDILFTLGQFDELIAAADLSFKSADRADNFTSAALAGAIKACTHAIRGEMALAFDAYAHASLAAEQSRLPGPISRVMRCRAFLHYRSREPREALAAIDGVDRLAREANDLSTVVDTFDLRSAAYWHLRDLDACEAAARGSLAAGEAIGWERARAFPLRYLAEVALQRRSPQEARALLREAHDVAAHFGDKRQLARVDLTQARFGLLEGDLDLAEDAAERAVAETTRLGLPPEHEEALALAQAVGRARRSRLWRRYYALRRPTRLSDAPVGGD